MGLALAARRAVDHWDRRKAAKLGSSVSCQLPPSAPLGLFDSVPGLITHLFVGGGSRPERMLELLNTNRGPDSRGCHTLKDVQLTVESCYSPPTAALPPAGRRAIQQMGMSSNTAQPNK